MGALSFRGDRDAAAKTFTTSTLGPEVARLVLAPGGEGGGMAVVGVVARVRCKRDPVGRPRSWRWLAAAAVVAECRAPGARPVVVLLLSSVPLQLAAGAPLSCTPAPPI